MPTRKEIADAIDARMAIALPLLAVKQAAYLATHKRYCQMLNGKRNPSDDKAGDVTVFDEFASQIESKLPAGIEVEIAINIYLTPANQHGFELTMTLTDGADKWQRIWNVGPEAHRDATWSKVV